MRSSVLLVLLGIATATNGCGGSSGGGGTGGAGGATGTGGATACSDATGMGVGATCNVIAAGGQCVTGTFSTAVPPAAAGGAFASGSYNLVSQTFYGSAELGNTFLPGVPFRETYVLSNVTSTSFTLDLVQATGTIVARSHQTAAVSGMTATFTQTCPSPDAGVDWSGGWDFTATSTSFSLFRSVVTGLTEVVVYDMAP